MRQQIIELGSPYLASTTVRVDAGDDTSSTLYEFDLSRVRTLSTEVPNSIARQVAKRSLKTKSRPTKKIEAIAITIKVISRIARQFLRSDFMSKASLGYYLFTDSRKCPRPKTLEGVAEARPTRWSDRVVWVGAQIAAEYLAKDLRSLVE